MPDPPTNRLIKALPCARLVSVTYDHDRAVFHLVHQTDGRNWRSALKLTGADLLHLKRGGVIVLRDRSGKGYVISASRRAARPAEEVPQPPDRHTLLHQAKARLSIWLDQRPEVMHKLRQMQERDEDPTTDADYQAFLKAIPSQVHPRLHELLRNRLSCERAKSPTVAEQQTTVKPVAQPVRPPPGRPSARIILPGRDE